MRTVSDVESDVLASAVGLGVGRQGRAVVSGITWHLRPGSWWWIEGPNGGGKSTLLMTLAGELEPVAGRLVVHPWIADGGALALVPQHEALLPTLPLTVAEYVALGQLGAHRGDNVAVAEALAAVLLPADRSYWSLSGGERQRARLARALARKATLILCDEPFNHVDDASVALLGAALGRAHAAGTAVVVVGHRLPTWAVRSGRLVVDGGACRVEEP